MSYTVRPGEREAYRPARARRAPGLPFLLVAAIALLPLQERIPGVRLRFAPTDALLIASALVDLRRLRIFKSAWTGFEVALLPMIVVSLLFGIVRNGTVTSYALLNKLAGMGMLLVLMLVLTSAWTSFPLVAQACRVFIWSGAAHAASSLLFFVPGLVGVDVSFWYFGYGKGRLIGPLVDPNAFGGYCVLVLLATLLIPNEFRNARLARFQTPIAMCLTLAIFLTFSRTAWIATIAGYLATLVIKRGKSVTWGLYAFAALAVFIVVLGPEFADQAERLATRNQQIDARVDILTNGFIEFERSPVVGIGVGEYQRQYRNIIHNTPVWILVEFGIVGAAVFAGFTLAILRRTWALYRWSRNLGAMLIAIHVAILGLGIGIEALYQRHWWFFIAMTGACYRLMERSRVPDRRAPRPSPPAR